jgi:hypothetical protein
VPQLLIVKLKGIFPRPDGVVGAVLNIIKKHCYKKYVHNNATVDALKKGLGSISQTS